MELKAMLEQVRDLLRDAGVTSVIGSIAADGAYLVVSFDGPHSEVVDLIGFGKAATPLVDEEAPEGVPDLRESIELEETLMQIYTACNRLRPDETGSVVHLAYYHNSPSLAALMDDEDMNRVVVAVG